MMRSALLVFAVAVPVLAQFEPGKRVLLDAHNCYAEHGRYLDRIDRALSTGLPLAIEQDLLWHALPTGGYSVVSHGKPVTGDEPRLKKDFFERIRPIVEGALASGRTPQWPLITLNLDFKSEEPEHLNEIWSVLREYSAWLTTAPKTGSTGPEPLDVKPVLVLTGVSNAQQSVFHDAVPPGERLLVFGAVSTPDASATNYRRWINYPWRVVEEGGQQKAADWTAEDEKRLMALVNSAHSRNLWIRFYTLNGHSPEASQGWTASYNFGSLESARQRWKAAIAAGVDFIATDQYELLGQMLKGQR